MAFNFGDEVINVFDMVSVSCTANKGDLPIDLHWLFNDEEISANEGISISRTGHRITTLSIENIQDEHRGNYTCVATNEAGVNRHTAELSVNGDHFTKCYLFYQSFYLILSILQPNCFTYLPVLFFGSSNSSDSTF